jgi:hypothetical protein
MNQHICNLLALTLAANSACVIAPCQAQTPIDSNNKNILPFSSELPQNTDNTPSFNNSEATIISDSANKAASDNTNATAIKPKPRIPISSRIFSVPSMQQ